MTYKAMLATTLSLFLFSCASTHPGHEGRSRNSEPKIPVKISAQAVENPDGEAFELIEVTIENTGDEWIRVASSEVLITNPAESKLSVVMDNDLKDWGEAMATRLRRDEHNRAMLQMGLLAAGAATAAIGTHNGNDGMAVAGAATMAGTYVWAVSDILSLSYKSATQIKKVPDNHLYHSYNVPGKMFLRRWILMNKPSKVIIKNLVVQLETVDGAKEVYDIPL